MILTCPNCKSQFKLDADLLGEDGAKVRCSSCAQTWFQEPEEPVDDFDSSGFDVDIDEDVDAGEDDFFEVDISIDMGGEEEDAVDSAPDSSDDDDVEDDDSDTESFDNDIIPPVSLPPRSDLGRGAVYKSYGIAASVFVVILLYLLVRSGPIMQSSPSMQAFYQIFGIQMEIPGTGLVFDRVEAVEENGMVRVTGSIINLEEEEQNIPVVEASLKDSHGEVLGVWYVILSQDTLQAEEMVEFDSVHYLNMNDAYEPAGGNDNHGSSGHTDANSHHDKGHGDLGHAAPDHAAEVAGAEGKQVRVRFVLTPKTDVKADGNNPAHHESGNDHQNDHGASSKSHPHASSQSHQEPEYQSHGASHSDHSDH